MKDLLRMSFIMIGLIYWYIKKDTLEWYWIFIILIGSVILSEIIFIGDSKKKKDQKNKGKIKESTVNKTNEKKKDSPKKHKKTDLEILQTPLESLDGNEFERLVAMYFEDLGYSPQIIGGAGDHEVDIILTDPKELYKIAVQCKHWKTKKVGNDIILRLSAGKHVHKCLDAWCITTNYYTKTAEEAANANKVRLWNGLHVHTNIVQWQQTQVKKLKS